MRRCDAEPDDVPRVVGWLPRGVAPVDVSAALLLGIVMATLVGVFPSPPVALLGLQDPGQMVVVVALTVVLMFRRAGPATTTLLVAAGTVALPGNWFTVAAAYSAGAHARPRTRLWLLLPALNLASFVGTRGWEGLRFNDHAFVLFTTTVCALAGLYVGTRRTLVAAAVDRAERAEREQALLADRARAEERTRLAAEMHDVVTHRINLMVLQAGALGVRSDDPEVRQAADAVRASGVTALAELRDLVGVLRAGADTGTARPDAADVTEVATLVGESRAVGVDVALTENGDPAVLAPTVHRTLVRVVQEALTNVRKHAPGTRVAVDLRYDERGVTASVLDDGPARDATVDQELAESGGGSGLAGLRQRVAMVGGTLDAGPRPDGGFAVHARLPAFVPTAFVPTADGHPSSVSP